MDAPRCCHACGVTEGESISAGVDQMACELRDPFGSDITFVRASECG